MFEQAVIVSPNRPAARIALLPISVGAHAFFFTAVLFLTMWRISFPLEAPSQTELRETMAPVPIPLEAPRPRAVAPAPAAQTPAPGPAAPAVAAAAPVTPVVTPNAIPSALPQPSNALTGDPTSQVGPAEALSTSGGSSTGGGSGVGSSDGSGSPMPVGGEVVAPQLLVRIEPVYPQVAVALRREGVVVLSCIIDRDGSVRSATPVRDDFPPLREAAIEAVRKWRFRPGSLHGRPIDTIFELRVNFRLSQ